MKFSWALAILTTTGSLQNKCHGFSPSLRSRGASSLYEAVATGSESILSDVTPRSKSRTQRIMEKTSSASQAGGAGGSSTYEAFLRTEENWSRLKASQAFEYDITNINPIQNGIPPPPSFVTDDGGKGNPMCWEKLRAQSESSIPLDYDVIVCGGTLGIFIAFALQMKGHRVAVVEAGKLLGREQEWNISMNELLELVELGVLTMDDIDDAVTTEFPGCRAGFKNKEGMLIFVLSIAVYRMNFSYVTLFLTLPFPCLL